MENEDKKSWAVRQLREKQEEVGRLPYKRDFDVVTLSRIKAFLGPWPRALETAGLKEVKPEALSKKKSLKRLKKRRKTNLKKKIHQMKQNDYRENSNNQ